MPQRAAAKAAAAAAPPAPSMSAVSTASTLPGQPGHNGVQPMQAQGGHQPTQSGLQSQASLGSQAGGQSSPMDIGAGAASDTSSKRGSNAAANMPSLQSGRLGLGLGLKPTANTGKLRRQLSLPRSLCARNHSRITNAGAHANQAVPKGAASGTPHACCCSSHIKMMLLRAGQLSGTPLAARQGSLEIPQSPEPSVAFRIFHSCTLLLNAL